MRGVRRFSASLGAAALLLLGAGACAGDDVTDAAEEKIHSGADDVKAEFRDEVPDRDWVPDSIVP